MKSRRRKIELPRLSADAPRWLFLATLVYAPWAYGCTSATTILVLNWLLGGVLALWAISSAVWREMLPVSWLLLVLLAAALIIGWALALNAHAIYDPAFGIYASIESRFPNFPGSYDGALSVAWMTRVTLLAGVLCFVTELSQRPAWLLRLWQTIGFAGASIALLGLLQKGSGAKMIFWQPWYEGVPYFFGPYYYHANAGAYLNLILPLTLGLTLRSFSSGRGPGERAIWIAAGVLVVIAVLANTSRMAQALALLIVIVFALWPARALFRRARRTNRAQAAIGIIVALAAVVAIARTSQLNEPVKRWQMLGQAIKSDMRGPAALVAWRALPDAGWFGFGPGTFRAIFPPYQLRTNGAVTGEWRFLHNDYLQTLLEFGRFAVVPFTVFFGGIAVALWSWRRARGAWLPRQRALIPLVVIALSSVAVHSVVDFPLQIASIQLYVVTYLGICWGSPLWRGVERPDRAR